MSRLQRLVCRSRYLASIYGWRLVVGVVAYYLVRDGVLYILLPYLAATRLILD